MYLQNSLNNLNQQISLNLISLSSHVLNQSSLLTEETLKLIVNTVSNHQKVMIIHERKEDMTHNDALNHLGIESLMEELKAYHPYLISSETKKPLEVFKTFQKEGQILIGTSVLLNLDEVFVKWDDFIHDRSLGDLNGCSALLKASKLISHSKGQLVIQTHQKNHPVLMNFNDSTFNFMAQELENAKQLNNLPPYADMVQIILESDSQKDLEFYSKSAMNYLKKALRDHAQILGPRLKHNLAIITVKSEDLDPYRSSLRSLIHAFYDDIKIELRTHQFII